MKVILVSVLTTLVLFTWDQVGSIPAVQNFDDKYDSSQNDPLAMIAIELAILEGIKCRKGFYNLSDDFIDATYHCAGVKHTTEGRRKFTGHQTVRADGPTPLLCLRVCVVVEAGMIKRDLTGYNETRVREIFTSEMTKPGGEQGAFRLSKEIMECDRKHPTIFPKAYDNCTEAKELFRCTGNVMYDCTNENNEKYAKLYEEYLAHKKRGLE